MKSWKANWICHIACRNCVLKHVIDGKIEDTGRRGRRRKQLLNDLQEKEQLLESELESTRSTLCRTRFEKGSGVLARQTTPWMIISSIPSHAHFYTLSKH